jgi:hypothetical protein
VLSAVEGSAGHRGGIGSKRGQTAVEGIEGRRGEGTEGTEGRKRGVGLGRGKRATEGTESRGGDRGP